MIYTVRVLEEITGGLHRLLVAYLGWQWESPLHDRRRPR